MVLAHRFAGSVVALADAGTEWQTLGRSQATGARSARRSCSSAAGFPARRT